MTASGAKRTFADVPSPLSAKTFVYPGADDQPVSYNSISGPWWRRTAMYMFPWEAHV